MHYFTACYVLCLNLLPLQRVADPQVGGSTESLKDLLDKPTGGRKEGSAAYEQFKKWITMQAFAEEETVVTGDQKHFIRHFIDDDFLRPLQGLELLRCYHQAFIDARDLKLPGQEADFKAVEQAGMESNWEKVVCSLNTSLIAIIRLCCHSIVKNDMHMHDCFRFLQTRLRKQAHESIKMRSHIQFIALPFETKLMLMKRLSDPADRKKHRFGLREFRAAVLKYHKDFTDLKTLCALLERVKDSIIDTIARDAWGTVKILRIPDFYVSLCF